MSFKLFFSRFCSILAISTIICSCSSKKEQSIFELLPQEATGITFKNDLQETPELNIFNYLYFYNGGGVAAGDLNGNGYPDLYFTSNMGENVLYLNEGNFKFTDVTQIANVGGIGKWTTGVTMADVNGDGKLDIYVSQIGDYKNIRGKNQLFINLGNDKNGIPIFEDQAAQWGLDLVGFSTQAAFFDYDLDGDLDVFILNHSVHSNGTYGKSTLRFENHPLAGDKLLRNDGDKFTDVTSESGIYSSVIGYGLGVTISDVNWDGYPDIYVGNDFHENDYLYINNGDGTFTEQLEQSIGHTSRYSMGNDIADINNDGLPDIISVDMLPADYQKLKASAGEDPYDVYNFKLSFGYNHQFSRNTLQINQGNGQFSEIAYLAGIEATDWSWSSLFADFDLDGHKDLFITNGIKRRMNDLDYINYISNEAIQSRLEGDLTDEDLALIEHMPEVKIPNFAFRNTGNLAFENVSKEWGLYQESFSNGAVYVDLDNDGDLDLVVNNVDQEAFIYRNNIINPENQRNNFLKIKFQGNLPNAFGIGCKIIIPTEDNKIIQELFPTRGYLSSVNNELVVGLGKLRSVDTLIVIWPDNSFQVLNDVTANQTITLNQKDASGTYNFSKSTQPLFENITDSFDLDYKHEENNFNEFNREPLIPHMSSTEGPKIAVGDVNGDGKDDFYIGGAKHQPGVLYIQNAHGFERIEQTAFVQDQLSEDTDALLIDVDKDGDLDLIVLSGGNEFRNNDKLLKPRLYKNNGKGEFTKDDSAFENVFLTGSCIRMADFNEDGFPDLFLGGHVEPWNYGQAANSYLLINDGKGNFKDQTETLAPGLLNLGMVKDAQWADLDGDGLLDLVVVGEWMPVTVFYNKGGVLQKEAADSFANSNGWWNTVEVVDIDNDGKLDILAGNLGLNSKIKASKEEPLRLFIKDYNDDGKPDPILFHFVNGQEQIYANKDELVKQLVELRARFISYADFANAANDEVFPKEKLKGAQKLEVHELRSGAFINRGNNNFEFVPFSLQAQFSPIRAFHIFDFNSDGKKDILSMGNFYEVNIQRGRYDADYGTLLENTGDGKFHWVSNQASGFWIQGQVRDIKSINFNGEIIFLIAKNNEPLEIYRKSNSKKANLSDLVSMP